MHNVKTHLPLLLSSPWTILFTSSSAFASVDGVVVPPEHIVLNRERVDAGPVSKDGEKSAAVGDEDRTDTDQPTRVNSYWSLLTAAELQTPGFQDATGTLDIGAEYVGSQAHVLGMLRMAPQSTQTVEAGSYEMGSFVLAPSLAPIGARAEGAWYFNSGVFCDSPTRGNCYVEGATNVRGAFRFGIHTGVEWGSRNVTLQTPQDGGGDPAETNLEGVVTGRIFAGLIAVGAPLSKELSLTFTADYSHRFISLIDNELEAAMGTKKNFYSGFDFGVHFKYRNAQIGLSLAVVHGDTSVKGLTGAKFVPSAMFSMPLTVQGVRLTPTPSNQEAGEGQEGAQDETTEAQDGAEAQETTEAQDGAEAQETTGAQEGVEAPGEAEAEDPAPQGATVPTPPQ